MMALTQADFVHNVQPDMFRSSLLIYCSMETITLAMEVTIQILLPHTFGRKLILAKGISIMGSVFFL